MRIRKLMYDSFYVNDQDFSGVTSVDSLTTDLYFHFTDLNASTWKLSGNTDALASGVILENSDTTAITVSPMTVTSYTGLTQQLTVFNQDGAIVTSECTFTRSNSAVTVSSGGLISLLISGVTTVTATHNDGPTGSTVVTSYWPVRSVVVTPAAFTGTTTGQTQQLTVVDQNGRNIIAECTFVSNNTSIMTVDSTGLVTFVGNIGNSYVTATHTVSGFYARPTTNWQFTP